MSKHCFLNTMIGVLAAAMFAFCLFPITGLLRFPIPLKAVSLPVLLILGFLASRVLMNKMHFIVRSDAEGMKPVREAGPDIIRILACVMVITVHYMIMSGYYNMTSSGGVYFLLTYLRELCMTCCPLFMVISGYFLGRRKFDCKHYLSVSHFVLLYALICAAQLILLPGKFNIASIQNMVSISEMWYIAMYFGLALLVPFINRMWDSLTDTEKSTLLFILLMISSFWTVTGKWGTSYWAGLYPFLYYFIGRQLREKRPLVNKPWTATALSIVILLHTIGSFTRDYNKTFNWSNFGGYSSEYNALPTIIATILFFVLIYDVQIKNPLVCRILQFFSKRSLEIYLLVTMLIGHYIESFVLSRFFVSYGWVGCYFFIMPLELILSACIGWCLNLILDYGKLVISKIHAMK